MRSFPSCTAQKAMLPRPLVHRRMMNLRVGAVAKVEGSVTASDRPTQFRYPWREGPVIIDGHLAHSMTEKRFEIVQSLDSDNFVKKEAALGSGIHWAEGLDCRC